MMNAKHSIQENYDGNADAYSQFINTPLGTLEKQLFDLCIHICRGKRVLDLGGGTGLRARDAISAGAVEVDVIDISPAMMRIGEAYEKSLGRSVITWHQGDASKPLNHLSLSLYDIVIANGIFDHARNEEELEMMWRNAAAYLKPHGRIIANRNNPLSAVARDKKYGVTFTDFQHFSGGLTYKYRMDTNPPLVFDSSGLEAYYSGGTKISGKFFKNITAVPFEDTPVVKADTGFWKPYLADPILYIFTADKL